MAAMSCALDGPEGEASPNGIPSLGPGWPAAWPV